MPTKYTDISDYLKTREQSLAGRLDRVAPHSKKLISLGEPAKKGDVVFAKLNKESPLDIYVSIKVVEISSERIKGIIDRVHGNEDEEIFDGAHIEIFEKNIFTISSEK